MKHPEFEYGPIAKGIFIALISTTPLVLFIDPNYLLPYICFLLFLGFGFRPFLLLTGLYHLWNASIGTLENRLHKNFLDERSKDIENQKEVEKIRKSRVRDSRLPKNW